jgi:hypothetical protein
MYRDCSKCLLSAVAVEEERIQQAIRMALVVVALGASFLHLLCILKVEVTPLSWALEGQVPILQRMILRRKMAAHQE